MRAGDTVRLSRAYAGLAAGSDGIVCGPDTARAGTLLVAFESGVVSVPRESLADAPVAPSVALAEAIRVMELVSAKREGDLWLFLAWIDRVIARRREEQENGG